MARKRPRDDDDDAQVPRKSKDSRWPQRSNSPLPWVLGSLAAFLLVTILAVAVVAVMYKRSTDAARLQGTWTMISLEQEGKATRPSVRSWTITITGNKMTVLLSRGDKLVRDIKVNTTSDPMEIDLISDLDTHYGIFKVEGDTLLICHNGPGLERPRKFDSNETHENGGLATYKRVK